MSESDNKPSQVKRELKNLVENIPHGLFAMIGVLSIFGISVAISQHFFSDKKPRYSKQFIESVTKIIKDAQENQNMAEKLKVKDPLLALQKIEKAQGQIAGLKRLLSEDEIVRITGFIPSKMENLLESNRDLVTMQLAAPEPSPVVAPPAPEPKSKQPVYAHEDESEEEYEPDEIINEEEEKEQRAKSNLEKLMPLIQSIKRMQNIPRAPLPPYQSYLKTQRENPADISAIDLRKR